MKSLTNTQITEMAEVALSTYEITADKNAAKRAAKEHAVDEFGIVPKKSAVLLAFNLAMAGWDEIITRTKQEISA